MAHPSGAPPSPEWHTLSPHDRDRRLTVIRRWGCRQRARREASADRRGLTVRLDGSRIQDVAGFYLALGEAVHGPGGYFGSSLDTLLDCLCGGFGVLPPFTIRLGDFNAVRGALDGRAWCCFRAKEFRQALADGESRETLVDAGYLGDGSPEEVARRTATYEAARAGQPFDAGPFGSYFDALTAVLEEHGAKMLPERDASAP